MIFYGCAHAVPHPGLLASRGRLASGPTGQVWLARSWMRRARNEDVRLMQTHSEPLSKMGVEEMRQKEVDMQLQQESDDGGGLPIRRNIRKERAMYQFSAVVASFGFVSLAVLSIYYRIAWHIDVQEEFPYEDLAGTLFLVAGGMVGMEMYARWVHRYMWHENKIGWLLHKSHHEPRMGPFEANDVYAVVNAIPAIALCGYGFMRPDLTGALCFGLGLGISLFGMAYMFVHDGLVHKRFPVGPVANVPWLRRVAVAHQMHHADEYGGIPFGMFLGEHELRDAGYEKEFERLLDIATRAQEKKNAKNRSA